jgi:hypothetical protein
LSGFSDIPNAHFAWHWIPSHPFRRRFLPKCGESLVKTPSTIKTRSIISFEVLIVLFERDSQVCLYKALAADMLKKPVFPFIVALIRIVYVSAAIKPFTPVALRELLSNARTFNSIVGVSRLLLYHERSFFQILEGREEDVVPLYARIGRDPRQDRVLLLSRQEVMERSCGAWSMGFVDVDTRVAKLPGFLKLLEATSSFLELQGDAKLTAKLIDGFQEGRWRQSIEP